MVFTPAHETLGLLDVELDGEDYHYMFIKRVDQRGILAQSERVLPEDPSYVFRFTLPVLDWVFEAKGKLQIINPEQEINAQTKHEVLITFESMEDQDKEQLEKFIEMHKQGQTQIKDIM